MIDHWEKLVTISFDYIDYLLLYYKTLKITFILEDYFHIWSCHDTFNKRCKYRIWHSNIILYRERREAEQRLERDRIDKERIEKERLDRERRERERREERDRIEREQRREQERRERERKDQMSKVDEHFKLSMEYHNKVRFNYIYWLSKRLTYTFDRWELQ